MSEEKLASIVHEFNDAFVKRDIEKALSYFQDDASYQGPEGTFRGKSEIKRAMTWESQNIGNLKIIDAGIGLLVKGNTAVYEFDVEGTHEGRKFVTHDVSIAEFKGEKVQSLTTVFDRVSLLKQLTKGWMATRTVNSIVNGLEKGLH
jgi:ketosteroid isomerase-like protein